MEKRTNLSSQPTTAAFFSIELQAVLRSLVANPYTMNRYDMTRLAEQMVDNGTATVRNNTFMLTATMNSLTLTPWRRRLINQERAFVAAYGPPPHAAPARRVAPLRPLLPLLSESEEDEKEDEKEVESSGTETDPRLGTSEVLNVDASDAPSFQEPPQEEPELPKLTIIHRAHMEDSAKRQAFLLSLRSLAIAVAPEA